jgi:hypothetical protein
MAVYDEVERKRLEGTVAESSHQLGGMIQLNQAVLASPSFRSDATKPANKNVDDPVHKHNTNNFLK